MRHVETQLNPLATIFIFCKRTQLYGMSEKMKNDLDAVCDQKKFQTPTFLLIFPHKKRFSRRLMLPMREKLRLRYTKRSHQRSSPMKLNENVYILLDVKFTWKLPSTAFLSWFVIFYGRENEEIFRVSKACERETQFWELIECAFALVNRKNCHYFVKSLKIFLNCIKKSLKCPEKLKISI